jgi:hypothetical protein
MPGKQGRFTMSTKTYGYFDAVHTSDAVGAKLHARWNVVRNGRIEVRQRRTMCGQRLYTSDQLYSASLWHKVDAAEKCGNCLSVLFNQESDGRVPA